MAIRTSWKVAWVTGASSGLGRELALQLARRGVTVAASARSEDKLAELARLHSNIRPYPVDVTDQTAIATTAQRIENELGHVDLAILNAGIWHPMPPKRFNAATMHSAFSVNVLGISNALAPLLPGMIMRRGGHIALVASVAGYRGLPLSEAYAPTKAAVISLAECLALDLHRHGVSVSVVNPGFIDTPMTEINTFAMPFMIKADDAAERTLRGLERGRYEIAYPLPMVLLTKLGRLVPNKVYFFISRLLTGLAGAH